MADAARTNTRHRSFVRINEAKAALLAFKQIATLQPVKVNRPRDRETDAAGAAKAARERGMNRLADRLDPGASDV